MAKRKQKPITVGELMAVIESLPKTTLIITGGNQIVVDVVVVEQGDMFDSSEPVAVWLQLIPAGGAK